MTRHRCELLSTQTLPQYSSEIRLSEKHNQNIPAALAAPRQTFTPESTHYQQQFPDLSDPNLFPQPPPPHCRIELFNPLVPAPHRASAATKAPVVHCHELNQQGVPGHRGTHQGKWMQRGWRPLRTQQKQRSSSPLDQLQHGPQTSMLVVTSGHDNQASTESAWECVSEGP